ncbi:MAG: hypothetical protein NWF09_04610 [Candidatus Bathyarchaeota archaeon]|nr:hypothetical protein [Candidatus Bathyarchaeota archaeon]
MLKIFKRKFLPSRSALSIPVTFLTLFVAMLGVISVTYYFAIEQVNSRSGMLKIATARQDMLALNENILQLIGLPVSARTFEISDSGGRINVQPDSNILTLSVNDGGEIADTIFNETVGQIIYELPFSETADTGVFLKGDSRTIVSQSGATITQLFIARGDQNAEILLRYRPKVSYVAAGVENGRAVNNIRIYTVNLNTSESIALYGKVPLRMACSSTEVASFTYELSYGPETLTVTSILGGSSGSVNIPIISTPSGAIINIELVTCNITIQRWIR